MKTSKNASHNILHSKSNILNKLEYKAKSTKVFIYYMPIKIYIAL